jgi:alanyl-tRNA synthetase
VGDVGTLKSAISGRELKVLDCQNNLNFGTVIKVEGSSPEKGEEMVAHVDLEHRHQCSTHHTATHVLQSALKSIVSDNIKQAGSKVSASGLRFDYLDDPSCAETLAAPELSEKLIRYVESVAKKDLEIETQTMTFDEAKNDLNAISLYGAEKYGDVVRVVICGDESVELCGGTHLQNTRDLWPIEILSIKSIGKNIKRVEAKVGAAAVEYIQGKREQEEQMGDEEGVKKKKKKLSKKAKQATMADFHFTHHNCEQKKVVVHLSPDEIDLMSVKNMAHKCREEDPLNAHVVVSLHSNGNLSVAIASQSELIDSRKVLQNVFEWSGKQSGGGGGNFEFASGIGKQCQENSDISTLNDRL